MYKTGDRHPIHKFLAFVEYDPVYGPIWTSVHPDPEAPFRLATSSKQGPPDHTRTQIYISPNCTEEELQALRQQVREDALSDTRSA